jgi:hypothetical protein
MQDDLPRSWQSPAISAYRTCRQYFLHQIHTLICHPLVPFLYLSVAVKTVQIFEQHKLLYNIDMLTQWSVQILYDWHQDKHSELLLSELYNYNGILFIRSTVIYFIQGMIT